jgi:hypothetical protein
MWGEDISDRDFDGFVASVFHEIQIALEEGVG